MQCKTNEINNNLNTLEKMKKELKIRFGELRDNETAIYCNFDLFNDKLECNTIIQDAPLSRFVETRFLYKDRFYQSCVYLTANEKNDTFFERETSVNLKLKSTKDCVKYLISKQLATSNYIGQTLVNTATLERVFNELKEL